ncbi:MAG: UvrB/UvrC motif-containing protein [Firmicutes bacterium]|nr:UvrB/UvrC motif-containing protein [Bacillota bacterium]
MLCDECNKNQATVKLIAIIEGNRTERNLCTACMAKQKGKMRAIGIQGMLSAIWNAANKAAMRHPGLACSRCGMEYDIFLRTGRLGCSQCYQDFRAELRPLLIRLHGHSQHAGHVPERIDEASKANSRVDRLRREMEIAVACEDFEQAALLRDELRALTMASKGGGADV